MGSGSNHEAIERPVLNYQDPTNTARPVAGARSQPRSRFRTRSRSQRLKMTTRPNTRSTGPPIAPQLSQEQLNELNVHRELRQLLNSSLPTSQWQLSPIPNPRVDHTYRRQVSLPPSSKILLQHFMDSSDQPVTTNASVVVEQIHLD